MFHLIYSARERSGRMYRPSPCRCFKSTMAIPITSAIFCILIFTARWCHSIVRLSVRL